MKNGEQGGIEIVVFILVEMLSGEVKGLSWRGIRLPSDILVSAEFRCMSSHSRVLTIEEGSAGVVGMSWGP